MSEKTTAKLVNSSTIAQIFGVSTQWVQTLTRNGIIHAVSRKGGYKYDLLPTIQRYIKHLTEKADAREQKQDNEIELRKQSAEADLKRSKADMAALQLRELEANMHRSEDVEAVMTDLAHVIRGLLMALPGRLAVDIAGVTSAAEASEAIRAEVYRVLEELATYKYDPEAYARRAKDQEGSTQQAEQEGKR